MALLKKDDVFVNDEGYKVIVTAVNNDGTVTLHYAEGSGKTGYAGKVSNRRLPEVHIGDAEFEGLQDSSSAVTLDEYNTEEKVPTIDFNLTSSEKDFLTYTVNEYRRLAQERLANSHSGVEQFMLQSNIQYSEDVLTKFANTQGNVSLDSIESQVVKESVKYYIQKMSSSVESVPDYPIKDDMKRLVVEAQEMLGRIEEKERENEPKYNFDLPSI